MLLTLLSLAHAKYAATPPATMIKRADVLVTGEIVSVDAETFTVKVDEVVAGPQPGELITVSRYQDWTCSSRWQPYAPGQAVLLLLVESDDGLRIQSAGGEGEVPIFGETIYLKGGLGSVAGVQMPVGEQYGSPVPLADFLDAAALLRACETSACRAEHRSDSPTHAALLR